MVTQVSLWLPLWPKQIKYSYGCCGNWNTFCSCHNNHRNQSVSMITKIRHHYVIIRSGGQTSVLKWMFTRSVFKVQGQSTYISYFQLSLPLSRNSCNSFLHCEVNLLYSLVSNELKWIELKFCILALATSASCFLKMFLKRKFWLIPYKTSKIFQDLPFRALTS